MFQRRPSRRGQRGNALVEYVLLFTVVSLAALMGVSFFGRSVSGEMGAVANELSSLLGGEAGGSSSGGSSGAGAANNGQGGGSNGHGGGNGGQNNGNGGADNGTGNGK